MSARFLTISTNIIEMFLCAKIGCAISSVLWHLMQAEDVDHFSDDVRTLKNVS